MKDGTRVRLTIPEAVYRSGDNDYYELPNGDELGIESNFTVEVLSEPLDPEPPVGSVVLDKDKRAWQRYEELAQVLDSLPLLVREARRARGLSLRAAATQVGMSFNTVYRFEAGENVTVANAAALLRWLDPGSER